MDDALLQRALVEVVGRHEILRTVYSRMGALQFPVQIIRGEADVWLPTFDLNRSVPTPDWPDELEQIYRDFHNSSWDFQNGPLVQAQIVHLAAARSAILIRASRLCSDKAGLHNVIIEMLRTFGGHTPSGAAQPPQYADISEYLNETLESEETAPGRQFWRRWKGDLHPPLQVAEAISIDRTNEQRVRWNVDSRLFVRIEELAAHDGVAVVDVLLASWQVVLSRYFHHEDFTIGIVSSGRDIEGLDGIPGTFERILPFPCRSAKELTFEKLVHNVAHAREQMLQWKDYFSCDDFDVRTTAPAVAFEYSVPQRLPDRKPAILHVTTDESLYPHQLKLVCFWKTQSPFLQISYNRTALSERDVAALQDQLNTLLLNAAGSPLDSVSRLSTLSAVTRNYVLNELNKTAIGYPGTPAHVRFQSQARRTPSHTAVVAGAITLTYRELDERSTQLAEALKSRGIGLEIAVAVCMERCPELLIALLAVLKSGGYYIPLDPGYPAERLQFVLRDSRAALLLTNAGLPSRLTDINIPVLNLDDNWAVETATPEPGSQLQPLNLAYTIYTSGSTGQPKGVAISHRALSNYLDWCEQNYHLGKGHGVIVHSPIGFDLTVTTLLAPLCVGQKLVLLQGEDPATELAHLLRKDAQFTLIKVTPAHLQVLSQLLDPKELSGAVHTVIIDGEALFTHHVEPWRAHVPPVRLINEYGPTEATVGCSIYEIDSHLAAAGPIPIGHPIANAMLYVLDSEMQPVPFQSTGELYIGGAGLARGYLGQVELTAARFVPNPFSTSPGERLYKTGDLARYDADGTLCFLGRNDNQIKLRGYRIELAEIEQTLRQHPSVIDAAVIVKERGEQKQLLACVAAAKGKEPASDDLHNFLSSKLPEYMIPSQIVVLDQLPLTFHGKVDKRALLDPGLQTDSPKDKYAAPRTANEQVLAELWAKALGIERVGIHSNFFELGGDSIMSIQIVNRARQRGLVFTPRQLFHHRTIAELAQVVKADSAVAALPATSRHGNVELTPIQRWFFEQKFAHPHHWNQAMLLEAQEQVIPSVLEKALSLLVERHDALRLRFQSTDGGKVLLTSKPGGPFVVVLDLSGVHVEKHQELLESFTFDLQSGMDLARGPLMKVGLVRGHKAKDRLLWAIHHLAVDVVSWSVLVEDLTVAYRQLRNGSEIQFQPHTSSFQECALRVAEHAQSQELKQELDYWIAPARRHRSRFPVDFPEGRNLKSSEEILWCSLDSKETNDLTQQVPRAFHTMINDVLLTALLQSFHAWTNEKVLTLDLENHGREELFDDIDLSRTVGWFTCIFPVTLTLASAYDCVSNLQAVKEQIRSIANGGLGYGLLRYVTGDRQVQDALEQMSPPEINFKYLGRSGQHKMGDKPLFVGCDGVRGPTHNALDHRPYLLEITGGVNSRGELRMAFIYSRNVHRESSIQKLAAGFIEALREIVRSSCGHAAVPSLVDVSMTQLNNMELNRLVEELSRSEEPDE